MQDGSPATLAFWRQARSFAPLAFARFAFSLAMSSLHHVKAFVLPNAKVRSKFRSRRRNCQGMQSLKTCGKYSLYNSGT